MLKTYTLRTEGEGVRYYFYMMPFSWHVLLSSKNVIYDLSFSLVFYIKLFDGAKSYYCFFPFYPHTLTPLQILRSIGAILNF